MSIYLIHLKTTSFTRHSGSVLKIHRPKELSFRLISFKSNLDCFHSILLNKHQEWPRSVIKVSLRTGGTKMGVVSVYLEEKHGLWVFGSKTSTEYVEIEYKITKRKQEYLSVPGNIKSIEYNYDKNNELNLVYDVKSKYFKQVYSGSRLLYFGQPVRIVFNDETERVISDGISDGRSDGISDAIIKNGESIHPKVHSNSAENSRRRFMIPPDHGDYYTEGKCEVLIDGLQTFGRYYHYMLQAKSSIDLTGWEMSLSFGLIYAQKNDVRIKPIKEFLQKHNLWDEKQRWISLQDVLLAKAAEGVKIRIMVWRHDVISLFNRYLYLGEMTIEREVQKLQQRAKSLGMKVKVFHYNSNLPDKDTSYGDPFNLNFDAEIVCLIVGNPKGFASCHHEKIVAIDAHHPKRCVVFTGGFDLARGRFDQPAHLPPKNFFDDIQDVWNGIKRRYANASIQSEERFTGKPIQPWIRYIRLLWHDIQIMLQGPATRIFYLHFAQRWHHAFSSDVDSVLSLKLPDHLKYNSERNTEIRSLVLDDNSLMSGLVFPSEEEKKTTNDSFIHHPDSELFYSRFQVIRQWPAMLSQGHGLLLQSFSDIFQKATDFLYIEHQYPFHNFTLTQSMRTALMKNPNLHCIIVTPIKTDLPGGIVGQVLDISQDDIDAHLESIYLTAPERVGIYGIAKQPPNSVFLKSVYIHSKLVIQDDQIISIGSSNLDNLSFLKCSEMTCQIPSPEMAKRTRVRLMQEHLQDQYHSDMENNFLLAFKAFRKVSMANYTDHRRKKRCTGRIFPLFPKEYSLYIQKQTVYPNPLVKLMFKYGAEPQRWIEEVLERYGEYLYQKEQLKANL